MQTNTATVLKYYPFKKILKHFAKVVSLKDYKEKLIEKKLNSFVNVKGHCCNVQLKDLFSPFSKAAVVIRHRDGSYTDPCDFGSYLIQVKNYKERR